MIPTRADDIVFLELLDARDRVGMRGPALRDHMRRLTGEPWTNGRVQGLLYRVARDFTECTCEEPENRDGGMPPRWWADGVGA